ncbi:MAG: tRNA (adenosine(37)-N6)-threonylcarbamoyltransferase complex ATPase subunit type 1 TsaE [Gammaproteobacteria bacterium]
MYKYNLRALNVEGMSRVATFFSKWEKLDKIILIGLVGDLGSGKTHWTREFFSNFDLDISVPSPTYTLIEPYESLIKNRTVYHADIYRLGSSIKPSSYTFNLCQELGIYDLIRDHKNLILVEWIDLELNLLENADLLLTFRSGSEEDLRDLEIKSKFEIIGIANA